MYDDLAAAFDAGPRRRPDRRRVLTGAGDRAFCVGADLGESIPALADGALRHLGVGRRAPEAHRACSSRSSPRSTASASAAASRSCSSTDLRIAASDAVFGFPETGIGVVPAGGTLTRLARQIPYAWAMELLLLGRADRRRAPRCATGCSTGSCARAALERPPSNSPTGCSRAAGPRSRSSSRRSSARRHAPRTPPSTPRPLFGQQAFASATRAEGLAAFAERRPPTFPSRRTHASEEHA